MTDTGGSQSGTGNPGEILVECAWCGGEIRRMAPTVDLLQPRVSHGVCLDCLGGLLDVPVTDMHALDSHDVDCLPFGFLELTRMGVVRRYNAAESELSGLAPADVIGKDFFREVAPCTQATEFEAQWRSLLRAGGGDADFQFIFQFRTGHRLVRIRMLVDEVKDRHLILVQDLDRDTEDHDEVMQRVASP